MCIRDSILELVALSYKLMYARDVGRLAHNVATTYRLLGGNLKDFKDWTEESCPICAARTSAGAARLREQLREQIGDLDVVAPGAVGSAISNQPGPLRDVEAAHARDVAMGRKQPGEAPRDTRISSSERATIAADRRPSSVKAQSAALDELLANIRKR